MSKEILISFTMNENGIMTKDEPDKIIIESGDGFRCRVYCIGTSEVTEWAVSEDIPLAEIYSRIGKLLEHHNSVEDCQMIRWISKEAFAYVRQTFTKIRMVLGYVTALTLYPPEVAALYDDYIRKNTALLFKRTSFNTKEHTYSALLEHAFAIGKPSKTAIKAAMWGFVGNRESALYELLADHYRRLYPRSSTDVDNITADIKKEELRIKMHSEARRRMEILNLSFATISDHRAGRVKVSDQCSMGKDPKGDHDPDSIREVVRSGSSDDIFERDVYLSHRGVVWSLRTTALNEDILQQVKEAEEMYNVHVYHIHRCQVNEEMVLYAFLVMGQNEDEWEHAREMTSRGLPDCVAPIYGYGGFEYCSLPVKPVWGCLLRTN